MHLTVIDHHQQPSLNKTKKQPNNQLLTLATLLLNNIYYPVIDKALREVDRHFGRANSNIMCGIEALTPGSGQFLKYSSITKFAEQYKSNVGDLAPKLKQMKRMIERKTADNTMPVFGENTSTLLDFSNFVSKYDGAFYELSRLLQIACTMPVTSLACERSFSCLKLIKTHLRTTMLDNRLSSLAVLLMHSERVNELDFEKVICASVSTLPHSVNSINTLIGRLFHSSSFTLSECIDRIAKVFSFLLLV